MLKDDLGSTRRRPTLSATFCGLIAAAAPLFLLACGQPPRRYAERANAPEEVGRVRAATSPSDALANTLTSAEEAEGWELLFDGRTTSGWRGYGKDHLPAAWKVEEGTLAFDPTGTDDRGDVVTAGEYTDFDLRIEWKISPKGNSGIFFHVAELPGYAHVSDTGPEMQVLDNDGHEDGVSVTHRAGDLYGLMASRVVATRPVGHWNEARIVLKDGLLQHWLNGQKIVATSIHDEQWAQMIANSKFADIEVFGVQRKGRFGLQDHGDKVWYRNIKVLRLSE